MSEEISKAELLKEELLMEQKHAAAIMDEKEVIKTS